MNFLSQISNYYYSPECNRCLRCLLYPVHVITLIIKCIFKVLQSGYENIFYSQKQRKLRKLNKLNHLNEYFHQHKSEFKKAFFQLGAMNVVVDMENMDELLQKMNEKNTGSILFKTFDSRRKALKACKAHLSLLKKQEYTEGRSLFKCINAEVKVCAQRQTTRKNVANAQELVRLLSEVPLFSDTVTERRYLAVFPMVVHAHFVEFKALFQQYLPNAP